MREVQLLSIVEALGVFSEDCGGVPQFPSDMVCYVDAPAEHAGRIGLSVGAAVAKASPRPVPGFVSVCSDCGTWFPSDEETSLPCGSTWSPNVDRTENSVLLARGYQSGYARALWCCAECGAVFHQVGALRGERQSLAVSVLSGIRIKGVDRYLRDPSGFGGVKGFPRFVFAPRRDQYSKAHRALPPRG